MQDCTHASSVPGSGGDSKALSCSPQPCSRNRQGSPLRNRSRWQAWGFPHRSFWRWHTGYPPLTARAQHSKVLHCHGWADSVVLTASVIILLSGRSPWSRSPEIPFLKKEYRCELSVYPMMNINMKSDWDVESGLTLGCRTSNLPNLQLITHQLRSSSQRCLQTSSVMSTCTYSAASPWPLPCSFFTTASPLVSLRQPIRKWNLWPWSRRIWRAISRPMYIAISARDEHDLLVWTSYSGRNSKSWRETSARVCECLSRWEGGTRPSEGINPKLSVQKYLRTVIIVGRVEIVWLMPPGLPIQDNPIISANAGYARRKHQA